MTDTTEQTRYELFRQFEATKKAVQVRLGAHYRLSRLDTALEAHLEELRKDLNFACALIDLNTARMAKLVQERDDIQGRLHAIDHAYHVQSQANAVAGDELRHCKEVITKQRLAIEALTSLLETRKTLGATLAQDSRENVQQGPNKEDKGVLYELRDVCCRDSLVYRDGSGDLHCRSCGK